MTVFHKYKIQNSAYKKHLLEQNSYFVSLSKEITPQVSSH